MSSRVWLYSFALVLVVAGPCRALADDSTDSGPHYNQNMVRIQGGATLDGNGNVGGGAKLDARLPGADVSMSWNRAQGGGSDTYDVNARLLLEKKQDWSNTANGGIGVGVRGTLDTDAWGLDVGGTYSTHEKKQNFLNQIHFLLGGFETRGNDPSTRVDGALIMQRISGEMKLSDTVGLGGAADLGLALTSCPLGDMRLGFIGQLKGWLTLRPIQQAPAVFIRPEVMADATFVKGTSNASPPGTEGQVSQVRVQGGTYLGLDF